MKEQEEPIRVLVETKTEGATASRNEGIEAAAAELGIPAVDLKDEKKTSRHLNFVK